MVTSCKRVSSCQHRATSWACYRTSAHITTNVLLLAQDGFVPIKLALKLNNELLHTFLIGHTPLVLLENLLVGNVRRDRIKLRILDACRLLEFGIGLGLGRDQLWARAERREVPSNGARLVQLETIFMLIQHALETQARW